jgi:hypothetical protein
MEQSRTPSVLSVFRYKEKDIMKHTLIAAVAALAGISFSVGATAQTRMQPNPMQQNRMQHSRIQQGVRSGELNRSEARYLRQQNRYIDRMKRYYMQDGRYTMQERRNIRMREQRLNRRIYQMKHHYPQR